jgi:DNA-binding HxlR family transcriptional regulator
VEYELTNLGRSFLVPMQLLVQWADENHVRICTARLDYANGGTGS